MDTVKMAILELLFTLGSRDLARMRKDLYKEKNDLKRASKEKLIKDTKKATQIVLNEICTLQMFDVHKQPDEVGGTD